MLDWISVIVALLLAVIIYVVVARKKHMWPFGPKPEPKSTDASHALITADDNKMKSILLFVLILVLLLIAMIISRMVKRKESSFMRYKFCGGM
jgi:hypothetical protein